jgi:hypothetical protein
MSVSRAKTVRHHPASSLVRRVGTSKESTAGYAAARARARQFPLWLWLHHCADAEGSNDLRHNSHARRRGSSRRHVDDRLRFLLSPPRKKKINPCELFFLRRRGLFGAFFQLWLSRPPPLSKCQFSRPFATARSSTGTWFSASRHSSIRLRCHTYAHA